ncbi:membrane-binding protein [Capnocytophaga sp.]|uniref:membrane-binding protein n=1 Tax=Capnocytophaga sp. TaxID=44737 RepID=UPI0026DC42FE|nr:membrane-binding protein [Capnocytophaga sp.]MDO5104528.1 membrane-binding protein [Capnocytophaga sp.]
MASKSYAENIKAIKLMIDGLRNHKDNLPAGIDEAFIDTLESLKNKVETLNSEQEKLKADLKTKTEAFDKEFKLLAEKQSIAKKRTKMDFPQSQWREFGIEDKK